MKIALFGATGQVGKRIIAEALERGHDVLAVVRNPATARLDDRVLYTAGDATHALTVAGVVAGADVVVSAVGPRKAEPSMLVKAASGLAEGLAQAGVGRLVVIGCSGDPMADAPDPGPAHREAALVLGATESLNWTYVMAASGPAAGGLASAVLDELEAPTRSRAELVVGGA